MNYFNPYYNNYMGGYGQPIQPQQQTQYYNTTQQFTQPTQNYLPLTFVNGIEGAKAFIVQPNQIVYLMDSDSQVMFEKSADAQGKYTIKAYMRNEIALEDVGKEKVIPDKNNEYITKSDLNAFKDVFNERLNNLTLIMESGFKRVENGGNTNE